MLTDQIAASSVTFRDLPLEGALHHLRTVGFTLLDLTAIRHFCDHFDPLLVDVGEQECIRVKELVDRYRMHAVSVTTYPANPLAHDLNGDDWTSGVDAYVRLTRRLQAAHIIFPPGSPAPAPDRWRGTAEHAKPWLRDAVQRAQNARQIPSIALQSHSLLRTSQQGMDFLRILHQPGPVGLAVDPAHLAAVGEDPVTAIRQMGKAITYVVLRDTDGTDYNLPPGSGTLNYPGILAALDDVGYAGPLILAIDNVARSADERRDLLARGWEYLTGLLEERKAA